MKKALISALFLAATSSVAMAKPVVTYSAGASVSIGVSTPKAPVVVVNHTHVDHDCAPAPAPVYIPPVAHASHVYKPVRTQPIVWNPNNTTLGADSSSYIGPKPMFQQARFEGRWGRSQWIAMTEPTRIDRGREFFTFGAEAGRFRKIQLAETAGRSFIQQVAIEFVGGGRTQVVKLDAQLVPGAPLTIDLDGDRRQINRIVVYGSTAPSSAYQILGM